MATKTPTTEKQAMMTLLSTADAITASAMRLLSGYGLTFTQYNVLRILRGAGEAGLTCSEISERMISRDSDITRLLDRLEQMDLISRWRDTNDRRVVRSRVSKSGLNLLAKMDEPVDRWDKESFRAIDEMELHTLIALLERIKKPLNQNEPANA